MEHAGATVRSAEVHLRAGGAAVWSRSWVSRWLAGEAPADDAQIALLLEHCDSDAVARAAAWLAGGTYVRGVEGSSSLLGALAAHAERHASAVAMLSRALDDGLVDADERDAVLTALDAEIASLSSLRARVAAQPVRPS